MGDNFINFTATLSAFAQRLIKRENFQLYQLLRIAGKVDRSGKIINLNQLLKKLDDLLDKRMAAVCAMPNDAAQEEQIQAYGQLLKTRDAIRELESVISKVQELDTAHMRTAPQDKPNILTKLVICCNKLKNFNLTVEV
jgi:hypothetical protein